MRSRSRPTRSSAAWIPRAFSHPKLGMTAMQWSTVARQDVSTRPHRSEVRRRGGGVGSARARRSGTGSGVRGNGVGWRDRGPTRSVGAQRPCVDATRESTATARVRAPPRRSDAGVYCDETIETTPARMRTLPTPVLRFAPNPERFDLRAPRCWAGGWSCGHRRPRARPEVMRLGSRRARDRRPR